MPNVDLSSFNLDELRTLQDDIERAINDLQSHDVRKAREQVLAIARNAGISVEELLAISFKKVSKTGGQKAQPQYQNPKDTSQTWTGRGRKPRWIADALTDVKKLEDFRIE